MCLLRMRVLIFTSLGLLFTPVVIGSPSCPYGWYQHGSSCYVFIAGVLNSWTEAMSFCKALSAKLVEIETQDENHFLSNHLQRMAHGHNYWIGLTDAIFENEWLWMSTQKEAQYTNWGPFQPDNDQHMEDCADIAFFGQHGLWNDENCDTKQHFICEKDLTSTTTVPPVGILVG
ncbi:perlucin-like [Saccostrea cucullata]|uniref:perlucin-like n=1 Tax=Saccostrea cuccullata TaxID=36930 RepID=UPI002ED2B343